MVFEGKKEVEQLLEVVWQLKGIKRNIDKGRDSKCFTTWNVKPMLVDCQETRNQRIKFLNEKCLNMNKQVAYRKIL